MTQQTRKVLIGIFSRGALVSIEHILELPHCRELAPALDEVIEERQTFLKLFPGHYLHWEYAPDDMPLY